ncbi:hypothetical protein D3C75_1239530 [compost metagenome]
MYAVVIYRAFVNNNAALTAINVERLTYIGIYIDNTVGIVNGFTTIDGTHGNELSLSSITYDSGI